MSLMMHQIAGFWQKNMLQANDARLNRSVTPRKWVGYHIDFKYGREKHSRRSWPRSRMLGADIANIPQIWNNAAIMWTFEPRLNGTSWRKMITGTTRDSAGAALGGVTVQLFNTSTGLLVQTVVSDAGGWFSIGDPNAVACFMDGYLAGAPDRSGTTLNTITGV